MARDPQAAAIGARLRAELAGAARALTLEVTANLIEACPVDTGNTRARFIPSIGEPGEGASAQQAGMAAVATYKLGDGPLHITNNTPYLPFLLVGSSSQAAPGWDLAAIDQAVQTVQQQYGAVAIDVTDQRGAILSERGAVSAGNLAGAYSPFGGDE